MFIYLLFHYSIQLCTGNIDSRSFFNYYGYAKLAYTKNNGSFIEITNIQQSYTISERTVFNFYVKYEYCTYWEKIDFEIERNDKGCFEIYLTSSHYPEKCKSGYELLAYNYIPYDTNMTVVNHRNESGIIPHNSYWKFKHYDPFSMMVYLGPDECFDGLIYLENMTVDINYTYNFQYKDYTFDDVPYRNRPYLVNISINTRYFFKFGYKDLGSDDDEIHEINSTTFTLLKHCDAFNVTIYLLSSLTCNNSLKIELFNITADKNIANKILTEDDVPSECKIDIYPEDTIKIQPDEKKLPYSFIYDGICEGFDDLVQGCKNKTLDYYLCPFINDAVEAKCGFTKSIEHINPSTSKLYVTTTKKSGTLSFRELKHQYNVHIKCTNVTESEKYFKTADSHGACEKEVKIEGLFSIKDSVSYLTLDNVTFYISSYYIDPETVYLKNSKWVSYGGKIMSKNLILENSYYSIDDDDNYQFDTYSVVLLNKTERPQYQLEYSGGYLNVKYKDWNEEFYEDYKKIYYNQGRNINLYFQSHFIDIIASDYQFENVNDDINISLMYIGDDISVYSSPIHLNDDSKYSVYVTSSGKWPKVGNNKNITLTAFYEYIDLHIDVNDNITINQNQAISSKPYKFIYEEYQPLNKTNNSIITYFMVNSGYSYSCNEHMQELINCRFQNCSQYGSGIDYIIDARCVSVSQLKYELQTIHPNTDKLLIDVNVDSVDCNFTLLPHQCVVEIRSIREYYSKILGKNKNMKSSNEIKKRPVNIYGNIKEKVSYLTLTDSIFSIIGSPLNVHSLKLLRSSPNVVEKVQPEQLIVDFDSHINLFNNDAFDSINQYAIIIPYDYDDKAVYRIEFYGDNLDLQAKTKDEDNYYKIDAYYGFIPSNYAKTIGIIAVSHNFDFYIPYLDIAPDSFNHINITILNEDVINPDELDYLPEGRNKYKVYLNESGEWIPEFKLNVIVTSYKDCVEVSYNPQIKVKEEDMFNFIPHQIIYPTETAAPNPTTIPTPTPVPEIVKDLFENNKEEISLEEINEALDKKFDELENFEGNKVVVVNANTFPFQKQLNENQYIKPIPDSKINYIDGNLNLVLPDEGKVTIQVNKNDDLKLALKGQGSIEFEEANLGNEINIKNHADINGSLSLIVPDKVESISFDTVDISKDGEIKCTSKSGKTQSLKINDLKADIYTNSKLNSVSITNSLTIPQSAKLELNNVDVNDSIIYYNIMNFDTLDSILSGEFKDPPKSIKIKSAESTDNLISKSFNLLEGNFEDGICKKWVDKIDFPIENKYKYIDCYDSSSGLILAKKQKIMIELLNEPKKEGGNGGGDKKGLPPGAIAGIVVGVIVVIAVIVVVVIFVVRKKRNDNDYNDSSKEISKEIINI